MPTFATKRLSAGTNGQLEKRMLLPIILCSVLIKQALAAWVSYPSPSHMTRISNYDEILEITCEVLLP